ncbi:Arabinose 5-phosphate isomerase [Helicobacter bizzozeronii CCUG 35545]|nr:Arabinose 5-phosphate isomerase [Helicobacter bizzozeronii CCUG 35545]
MLDYARHARHTLELQANALLKAIGALSNPTLEPIINALANAPLVVVMGVGKSAHVGRKIAATMTSTGTKAIFLHPTEAMHGDMGIVGSQDAILAISYGGESVELLDALRVIPYKTLIAMSKDSQSSLGKLATYHLKLEIEQEAFHLVPTTSSTLSLALGDVLAVCLMVHKNFQKEDFALTHPGGLLGKQLRLQVKDVYRTQNLPLVGVDCSLHQALLCATDKGLGNALLVNEAQQLVGVLSDGDIRRALLQPASFDLHAPAKNFATLEPKCIDNPHMPLIQALEFIETHQISLLIVLDTQQRVLGVLHLHTLLALGLSKPT